MHVLQASIGAMKIRVKNELRATSLFCRKLNRSALVVIQINTTITSTAGWLMSTILMDNYFITKKFSKTNDCYMNAGYYLRHLKKSGTSK